MASHKRGIALLNVARGLVILGTLLVLCTLFLPRAQAFVRAPFFWPDAQATLNIRVGCPPSGSLTAFGPCWWRSARDAFRRWNQVAERFRFSMQSPTIPANPCDFRDRVNTVAFRSDICGIGFGDSTIAIALPFGPSGFSPTGELDDVTVLFNSGVLWDSYLGPLRFNGFGQPVWDFHRVAIHEFGHVLGLAHPNRSGQTVVAIMNQGTLNIDSLQPDDIDGVNAIYPVEGFGNIPGGDRSRPNEVSFNFEGTPGDVEISYEIFDADFPAEINILVNGVHVVDVGVTGNNAWSARRVVIVPDGLISNTQPNVVTFDNAFNPPNTFIWGVRLISLTLGPFGRIPGVDQSHPNKVSFNFGGVPGDIEIGYEVFDVDYPAEIDILVNGQKVADVAVTANNAWSGRRVVRVPDGLVSNTRPNVVTFDNTANPPKTFIWGVRNVR